MTKKVKIKLKLKKENIVKVKIKIKKVIRTPRIQDLGKEEKEEQATLACRSKDSKL